MGMENGENVCEKCEKFQAEIEFCRRTFTSNFAALKEKIISTDLLIRKYNAKCQEHDTVVKKLEESSSLNEQLKRDCVKYESELAVVLQEIEPLRKERDTFSNSNKEISAKLNTAVEELEALKKTNQQYSRKVTECEREETKLKNKVASLNRDVSRLTKEVLQVEKLKEEADKLKNELQATNKSLKSSHRKYFNTLKHTIKFGERLQSRNLLTKIHIKLLEKYSAELTSRNFPSENEDEFMSESDCDEAGLELERMLLLENNEKPIEKMVDSAQSPIPFDSENRDVLDSELLFDLIDVGIYEKPVLSPLPQSPKGRRRMMVQPVLALPNNSVEPLLDNTRDNSSGNLSMLDDIEKHYQPKNKQCSSDCCKRDSVESDLDHCDKSDEVNEKLMNSNHVGNEVTRASDFSVFGDEQAISVTDDELLEEKEETQTVNGRCGVSPAAVSDGSALVDLDHTYASVSPELSTDCGSADPEIMLLGDNLSRIWYDEDNNVMYIMSPSTSAEVETRESESCTDLDDVSELHFEANDVGVDNSQTACRPCVELAEPVTDKDGQSLSLSSNQISGDNREEYPSALMSPHDKQITDISTTISAVYPCRTLQASKGSVTFIKKGKTAENSLIGPTSVQPLERVVFSKKSSLLKDNMHVRLPPATLDLLCVEDLPTSLKSSKSLEDQQLSHKDVCQEAQKEKEHLLRQFRNDIPIRPPPKERVPVIYNSYGACLMKSCKSHESKHLSEGETNFLPPHLGLDEKHQNCEMDLSSDNLLTLYKRLQSTLDSLSLFNSYQNGCLDVYNPCGPFSCFGNPNLFYALNSIVSNRLKCSACSPQDMKCCTKASSNLQTSEKTKVVVEKTVANVNDHQQKVTSDKCLSEPPLNDKCHSELLKDKCEFEHVAQSHNGQVINKTKKKKKKKKRKNKSDSCDISINNSVINTTATTRMTCEASTVVRASNIKKASENNFAVKPSDVKKMPSFITSNVNSFTETKKSRRTKCLREKIKDCLKYGSDKKLLPKSLPVRRPTVPLVAFVPQKHQPQQQQKTEVNEMLEFLILPDSLKRPLSPFPGDPVSSVTKKQKVKEVNSLKPNCVQEVTAAKCLDSVHQDVVGQDNELCDEYKSDTPPEDVHHDAPVNFSPENTKETTSEQIDQLQDEFPESASTKNDDKTSQRNINSEEDTEIKSISAGLSTSVWSLSVSCKFLQEKNKTQEGTSVSDDDVASKNIDSILQLSSSLPAEGHVHVWQSVANRLCKIVTEQHIPLLSRKLIMWLKSSSLRNDTTKDTGNDDQSSVEKRCLNLVTCLRTKPDANRLEEELYCAAIEELKTTKMTSMVSEATVCRFVIALFRQPMNIGKVKMFYFDLAYQNLNECGQLLVYALTFCSETFDIPSHAAASPLLKTLVFILKERSSVVGLEEPWTSERFQEIANVVCISSVKVQELVGMCLESLKSGDLENCLEAIRALELLCKVEGWPWTNNYVIRERIWPILQTWSQQHSPSSEKDADKEASDCLFLLGCLCKQCPLSNPEPVHEVLKVINALLIKSLTTSVPWCVQESAVTVIFMLMPFDEEFALNSLKSWLPLNEKNVSQSLRELLRMKELLRT